MTTVVSQDFRHLPRISAQFATVLLTVLRQRFYNLACATMLLLSQGCVTVPYTGRHAVDLVPAALANSLGRSSFTKACSAYQESKNDRLTQIVQHVGMRLAAASGTDFPLEFRLLDTPDVKNAVCFPGGKVIVYSGILPIAASEAGLATILGHEMGHALAAHGAQQISRFLIGTTVLSFTALSLIGVPYGAFYYLGGAGIVGYGYMTPQQRRDEEEADLIGLHLMALAGYDPSEAPKFWERMDQAVPGVVGLSLLSDHPDSLSRRDALVEHVKDVWPVYLRTRDHSIDGNRLLLEDPRS